MPSVPPLGSHWFEPVPPVPPVQPTEPQCLMDHLRAARPPVQPTEPLAYGSVRNLEDARHWADQARRENLRGVYPSALVVLDMAYSRLAHPPVQPTEPVALSVIRKWPEGFEARLQAVWVDVISFIPTVKLYDLQRALAEFGFRMEVYEDAAHPPVAPVASPRLTAVGLLQEASTTLKMWADVAPAVSLISDIDSFLASAVAPVASEPVTPNDDEVICPGCAHQFRAIPPNVQRLMLDAGFEPPFTHPPVQPTKPVARKPFPPGFDAIVISMAAYVQQAVDEALAAHPPVQPTEPVAQVELIEESANEFPLELRERVRDAMRNAWVGGYNECVDAHPTMISATE